MPKPIINYFLVVYDKKSHIVIIIFAITLRPSTNILGDAAVCNPLFLFTMWRQHHESDERGEGWFCSLFGYSLA